jgi:hypothetical protein
MNNDIYYKKKFILLICKILIINNGYLSQLEILKYALSHLYSNNILTSDIEAKIRKDSKNEEYKNLLNFTLNILIELNLVTEKMENKSYYFKWNSIKNFYRVYNNYYKNNITDFEINESLESRNQIYTRYFLLHCLKLYKINENLGISFEERKKLLEKCTLIDNIKTIKIMYLILNFLGFINIIKKENINILENENEIKYKIDNKIFNFITKDLNDDELNEINTKFNENILNKEKELNDQYITESTLIEEKNEPKTTENNIESEKKISLEENLQKISLEKFNNDNNDVGFALLKGNNWVYYIKKLHCIIGRSPMKFKRASNPMHTKWAVDLDLGPKAKKVSKQHALIAYNFLINSFEIKNISKKFNIKVNGEIMNYNEEMILTNKSVIYIGNEDFYFLLPN